MGAKIFDLRAFASQVFMRGTPRPSDVLDGVRALSFLWIVSLHIVSMLFLMYSRTTISISP